jgi:hypothetical protein
MFVTPIKLAIYDAFAKTAQAPTVTEIATKLNVPLEDVQNAFDELHKQRLLVPEPGDQTRIRMAPPFSGIGTPFRVTVHGRIYFAPCAWDAFGIAAALHTDAVIHTKDGHSGESMTLEVKKGKPAPAPYVVHIAVPAAKWWDDIIYT